MGDDAHTVAHRVLRQFIAYRGLSSPHDFDAMSRDTLTARMTHLGHIAIDARGVIRGAPSTVVFLLLNPESDFARHKPDLQKLLSRIVAGHRLSVPPLREVTVFVEDDFLAKKNMMDALKLDDAAIRVRALSRVIICTVIPDHVAVPPHRIMSGDEARAFFARESIDPAHVPLIRESDPPVVWADGRAGDFVHIKRTSETTLESDVVRRVV